MNYLTQFNEKGEKISSIPVDITLTEMRKRELIKEGYIEIPEEEWAYYIGAFGTGKNGTGYVRGADGKPTDAPPIPVNIEELKKAKISEFKRMRDMEEVEDISYNGNIFDFDAISRERIDRARLAMEDSHDATASIEWTTAENNRVPVTVADLANINGIAAQRSNTLHIKYNKLKRRVLDATTEEEIENIKWT